MLNVQQFLLDQINEGFSKTQAFEQLTAQLGIKVKHYQDEGIVLLDYHMIDSPKTHPVVIECRSLILNFHSLGLVSRKFNRFFNLEESQEYYEDFDISRAKIMEKADGSLIGVYNLDGKWNISTRGMAFAEGDHAMGGSFKSKVLETFGYSEEEFQEAFNIFNKQLTFVFEYTSPENRIVTKYEKPEMVFLGANDGEKEWDYDTMVCNLQAYGLKNFRAVKMYEASDIDSVVALANSLPNLEEGFVLYDPVSDKRMKVKSSLYVVAHGLRGEDALPTKKNLLNLLFTGELDEFLVYFPEWTDKANEIEKEVDSALVALATAWGFFHTLESQKDFAIAIKDVKYNSILFQARKTGNSIYEVWNAIPVERKISMFN